MKREILFRGKRVDNGEWVEGLYFKTSSSKVRAIGLTSCIQVIDDINYKTFEVIPETVGQYTGLTDKNGKRIFEGDLLDVAGAIIPVSYSDGSFQIVSIKEQGRSPLVLDRAKRAEVIGNIHDNTLLMYENLLLRR